MDRTLIPALPLLVAACTGPASPEPAGTQDTFTVTPTDTMTPLASPADAVDEDPDPSVFQTTLIPRAQTHTIGDWTIDGYAYNGQVPGPTIRMDVGQELVVELENELDVPTTLHWHGMEVPWNMDGATWMMDPVQPGGRFTVRFTATKAGTFWYHPHFDTAQQVDRGLYGVVVVSDPSEPQVDHDEVWVLDSWNESQTSAAMAEAHTHLPDPTPSQWTVNGRILPSWSPDPGASTRVRILNASNGGYLSLDGPTVIATDQGLLAEARDEALLGPGDRAELDLGVWAGLVSTRPYSVAGGTAFGDPIALVQGPGTAVGRATEWPYEAAPPSPDPGHTDVLWVFHGDGQTETWQINGEVFPDVTVAEVVQGEPAVIEVRNLSGAEHPFHLHGQAFEVLSVDGEPPAQKWVEDTLNVAIRQTLRVQVHNPTPGEWMSHCHILAHAESGMMTLLRVADPVAP